MELSEADRCALVTTLLDSLPPLPFDQEDAGFAEALRRGAELDANPSMGISLERFDELIRNRRDC